ncbi:MAG: glycosyltransferase family 39 protein [Calditrichaceae bacterium]|nr:glycosyltransferase family 39 protein [Calditrichaceae bacterium]MBN2708305.1 glycosyltransferase family 39 protein [Calditrichaceae bacterium]RQV97240.1 MAG: hypothetical protein EH224_02145 [Calditrichota bacterium]
MALKSNLRLKASKRLLYVSLIIIIGGFLRFWELDKDSYWLDEGASLFTVNRSLTEMIEFEPNPPLFNIVLHYWIKLFGIKEQFTRLLPALFSLISLFFVFKLAKRLFYYPVALGTTLIFALSPYQIFYAQELRTYSLLFLLTMISMYYLIRLIDENLWKQKSIYIIVTLCLLLTHIYGWFVFLTQFLWIVYIKRKLDKDWLIVFIAIFILFLPYLAYFIPTISKISGHFWIAKPGIIHFFGNAVPVSGSVPLFLFYALLICILFFLWYRHKNSKSIKINQPVKFLLLWIIITYLVPFVLSLFVTPFFLERYLIVTAFPIVVIFVYLIELLAAQKIKTIIYSLFILLSLFEIAQDIRQPTREPWRDMALDLKAKAKTNDIFIVAAGFCIDNIFQFYSDSLANIQIGIDTEDIKENIWHDKIQDHISSDQNCIWLILSHFNSNEFLLTEYFNSRHQYVKQIDYPHRDLFGRNIVNLKVRKYKNKLLNSD